MDNAEVKRLTMKLQGIELELSDANALVKSLKKEKSALEAELIGILEDAGGMGCMWDDLGVRIGLKRSVVPTVKNWDAALQQIVEDNLLYLLQKSVNSVAWRELREDGVELDGVEAFERVTLSKTKYTK